MTASRALLVDDESCVLESLVLMLETSGFEIAGAASDLAGAVKRASEAQADVAILDINLGKELFFPAADVFASRDIPILLTSGRWTKRPTRCASMTFIEKPYPPELPIDQAERLASNVHPMRLAAQRKLENSAANAFRAMVKSGAASLKPKPKGDGSGGELPSPAGGGARFAALLARPLLCPVAGRKGRVKRQYGTASMSNLGFSLDRHFNASDATRRRARGLEPLAAAARQNSRRWTPAPFAGPALAALLAALAAKFLF